MSKEEQRKPAEPARSESKPSGAQRGEAERRSDGQPSEDRTDQALDVVGIGSMVVDRMHRAARLASADEKALLRSLAGAGPVQSRLGGVVLNHLGWAAALGLRTGIFGLGADDEGGRLLRARWSGSASSTRSIEAAAPARSPRSSSTTPASARSTWRSARRGDDAGARARAGGVRATRRAPDDRGVAAAAGGRA